MEEEQPIKPNRKNITAEITGDFIDLDSMIDDAPGIEAAPSLEEQPPQEEGDHALTGIIDIGLEMVGDITRDNGYPDLNTVYWDKYGKKALNRALNQYMPAGSGAGESLNSPLVALLIGIACLALCLYPVIRQYLQNRKAEAPLEAGAEPDRIEEPQPQTVTYEEPGTEISATAPISRMDVKPIERIMLEHNTNPGGFKGF